MDWQFVTHHLVSGYIPVAVALVLYFIFFACDGEKANHGAYYYFICILLLPRGNTDNDRRLHWRFFLPENCLYSVCGYDKRAYRHCSEHPFICSYTALR